MEKTIFIKNVLETKKLGELLGQYAKPKMVIALMGDLGAGKTTFTQGIAKGLGISRTVSSPTFTILKIHQGRMPLYHIDAYRLEGVHQDLGFEELMESDGLTVIEWPQYILDQIEEERLEIQIIRESEEERTFKFKALGLQYEKLLEELL